MNSFSVSVHVTTPPLVRYKRYCPLRGRICGPVPRSLGEGGSKSGGDKCNRSHNEPSPISLSTRCSTSCLGVSLFEPSRLTLSEGDLGRRVEGVRGRQEKNSYATHNCVIKSSLLFCRFTNFRERLAFSQQLATLTRKRRSSSKREQNRFHTLAKSEKTASRLCNSGNPQSLDFSRNEWQHPLHF
jgi:hypothetical protein